MYCGNNSREPDLLNGVLELGTRHGCLKKGIGRGMNLPLDTKYLGEYEPIDETRIYCGNKKILPADYDRFGNLPHCLQKGVGVGKKIRATNGNVDRGETEKKFNWFLFLLLEAIVLILLLLFTKTLLSLVLFFIGFSIIIFFFVFNI